MSDQFKRLGVIGDFEHPYLTLKPEFEARQIEIFGEMAKKGYIYKGLKPVYWCPDCRTALAEAEIEYGEDDCDSIFVRFHVSQDPNGVLAKYGIPMDKTYFVIWTTTTTGPCPPTRPSASTASLSIRSSRSATSTTSWPPSWSRA